MLDRLVTGRAPDAAITSTDDFVAAGGKPLAIQAGLPQRLPRRARFTHFPFGPRGVHGIGPALVVSDAPALEGYRPASRVLDDCRILIAVANERPHFPNALDPHFVSGVSAQLPGLQGCTKMALMESFVNCTNGYWGIPPLTTSMSFLTSAI